MLLIAAAAQLALAQSPVRRTPWKKHVVAQEQPTFGVVAGDFTGDGRVDVVALSRVAVHLYAAPDWKPRTLADAERVGNANILIHCETMDVDGDGDTDVLAARHSGPRSLIFWLEQPDRGAEQPWAFHLIDDQVNGTHGLIVGDIDRDGRPDLLANSALPDGSAFPNSLVWYRVPKEPRNAANWPRFVFADKDAPGLSHYFGFGDIDGDGRPDAACAAKGGPEAAPGSGDWFAWWQAPADPTGPWTKRLISDQQPGATNIHPADVNGDGRADFIASRGHGKGVVWFEAPMWKQHDIHAELAGPHCLVVADLDADGDLDAATCAKDDKLACWFENDGKGRFTTHIIGEQQAAYDIRAVDMDADGDLDLLIAGQDSGNVVWYENPRNAPRRTE